MSAHGTLARLRNLTRSAPAPAAAPAPLQLQQRLTEDLSWLPIPWLVGGNAFDRADGFGRGFANGSISDRRSGRDLPLFWSELDLRAYRVLARHICETNPFGIGFSGLLTDYHVRKGFGWQVCRKGPKKGAYVGTGGQPDPLVARAQQVLDDWRDAVQWPVKSREAFKRCRRDGEVFARFGGSGWGKLPWVRFVDPSQIGHPQGRTDGPESFGIAKPDGDVGGPSLAYHLWSVERPGTGEWVDAEWVLHARANVDSDVKRGLPDFFPVAEALSQCSELLATMLPTAIRQARVAWREKLPGATQAIAAGLYPVPGGPAARSPYPGPDSLPNVPYGLSGSGALVGNGFSRSHVVRVEGDREFEPGPTFAGASGYIEVEQAALRACGVRWKFPEYFSGDASNNNMASAFVANSPFVTSVECSQEEWVAQWERPVAAKVLELARDAGLLSWSEWAQLDVHVTAAAVSTPEPDKDATRLSSLIVSKVMCLDTARQQLGLDPQHEAEGVKKDAAGQQAPQQQPGGDQPAPTDPGASGAPPALEALPESVGVTEGAPGAPPRPGLTWNDTTHRWVRRDTGADHEPDAQADSDARDEAWSELASHEGGEGADYHASHDDFTADFGFSTPDEITDRFREKFAELLAQKDDYAAKAADYAGAGEEFQTKYHDLRNDLVEAGETYKDAIGTLAEAHEKASAVKQNLDETKGSPLDVEDYGRPIKKPTDPAKLPRWEQAMAEFQANKAAAIGKAKQGRAEEIADLKAELAPLSEAYKEANRAAKKAHADMGRANEAIVKLIAPLHADDASPAAKESRSVRESFTGVDANGHHWVDGKQVKAPDASTPDLTPTPPHAARKTPESVGVQEIAPLSAE